jgi:hypothetical protein
MNEMVCQQVKASAPRSALEQMSSDLVSQLAESIAKL